ncbi:MAG: toll/interleukin-1 receptor domain-containing protein [Thermoanaerobaculia bacterium]
MTPLYDVFLSHSTADKSVVETLAQKLLKEGINPFLDKWHLVPGDPWQEGIEEALDRSRTCALFVGPSSLGPWQNEEMRSALEDRVSNKKFRVIPVLLPGAPEPRKKKLPRFVRRLGWVDFRGGLADEEAFRRLVHGIKGTPPGPGGGGLTLPGGGEPTLRKRLLWLGLAVLAGLSIGGGWAYLAWNSHVVLLVPGSGMVGFLPKPRDPDAKPGDLVCSLRVQYQGKLYTRADLRRLPIYLGAPGRLGSVDFHLSASTWVKEVEGWSRRRLTEGEKSILNALSKESPLLVETARLAGNEELGVKLLCTKDGRIIAESQGRFTIDAGRAPQPVFLVESSTTDTQNEVP